MFFGLYLLLKGIDFFQVYGSDLGSIPELQLFFIDLTSRITLDQVPIIGTTLLIMGAIIAVLSFVAFLNVSSSVDPTDYDKKAN